MKLIIFSPSYSGGGAEKVAVNLANQYTLEGIDVTLVVLRDSGPYKSMVNDNVKCISLNVARARYALSSIIRLIRSEEPTHVLSVVRDVNIIVGLAALLNKNIKLSFREANTLDGLDNMFFLQFIIYKTLMRLAYFRANFVIANSKDTKNDLIQGNITFAKKISVIGNPVLPADFEELLENKQDNLHPWLYDSSLKVVLNVGRLHEQKNQALLIKAFEKSYRKDPSLRLIILGEGALRLDLDTLIESLKIKDVVFIHPFVLNPYPFYKNAKVFVLTSKWEGFGNVIVEALASGIPVISVNCPGGPSYILDRGRYGFLVNGNENCIADMISKITSSPIDIELSRSRGLEFSVKNKAAEYLSVII